MKIMICGSMKYVKEMVKLEQELKALDHNVVLPIGFEKNLEIPNFTDNLEEDLEYCIREDIMRKNFNQISKQDAILVVNKSKHGIDGYLGTAVLMELAIAYFLKKKIFLLHDIPHFNEHRWAHEVTIMQPTILKGDILKIR